MEKRAVSWHPGSRGREREPENSSTVEVMPSMTYHLLIAHSAGYEFISDYAADEVGFLSLEIPLQASLNPVKLMIKVNQHNDGCYEVRKISNE